MIDRFHIGPSGKAAERNKGPILEVLKRVFSDVRTVLEVGSGSGEHAVHFSQHLPHLSWQPSDHGESLTWLRRACEAHGGPNLLPPINLDAAATAWNVGPFDAVFTANTLQILPWDVAPNFFTRMAEVVKPGGLICVYGPFKYHDRHVSEGNEAFDAYLKQQDPVWGIRDFEEVHRIAEDLGLALAEDNSMPVNNRTLIWQRAG